LQPEPIPFFAPRLGEEEIQEVVDSLRSGWLTTGPKTRRFEQRFAQMVGADFAVAVNSATAAMHLALEALGVGPGDEVLVPTMTFASTAEVVIYLGAKPVLVDCHPETLCLDPAQFENARTGRTVAVMPMHYGGHPCQMDEILAWADRHGIHVVEDAAHAFPARWRDQTVGSIGRATCFSFYANKTITTGEGGMLTTDDERLAERARMMSLHGLSRDSWNRYTAAGSWYYEILQPGFKYNMTDIAAAIGIHQLSKAQQFRSRRQQCAAWYDQCLADLPQIVRPQARAEVEHAWHLYPIQLHTDLLSIGRNAVIEKLTAARIGTSVHWMPLHMHPYYRDKFGFCDTDFPVARAAFERLISLPIYPGMTRAQVERVAAELRSIIEAHRK